MRSCGSSQRRHSPKQRRQRPRSHPAAIAARCMGCLYALKDIIDYTGLPTTAHSKILIDNVAGEDAFVAARLRAAGGVHLGKLATHEFAIGGPSFEKVNPTSPG